MLAGLEEDGQPELDQWQPYRRTDGAVSATDNVAVAKVELYRDGTLVATRTDAPYDFSWADGVSGSYTLTAVAYDSSGVGSVSTPVDVTATQSDTAAPSSPTEPRSVANAQTQIDAVWTASTDNVGVVYYQLYANGVKMGTTSGTSFSYTGLTCGTGYSLGFAAVDAAGNMSPRKGMSAWTTACSGDTAAPSMPAAPQASVSGPASVSLSWSASVDNVGVTGYRIDRNGLTVGHTTSTSFFDTGLTAGTRYGYSITANDATGNLSGTSAPVYVTMPAGDTEPPSQPTGLQPMSITGSSISLSWQAATDNVAVAGYRIYRGGVQIGQTAGTSWTDAGLVSGIEYGYTVAAYDGSGNLSPQSDVALATTLTVDTVAPTAPTNLTASGMKGRKVNLKWAAATDNVGVAGYRVFRDGSLLATVTGSLTYTDSPSRGNHSYCVRAIDAASNTSAASNTVSVRV